MRKYLIISLLALTACGSSEEKVTVGDTEITVNEDAGTTQISGKDGALNIVEGAAAEAITPPAFAPKYPASTFVSAMVSDKKDGEKQTIINFTTPDDLKQIATFYQQQFAAQGLQLGMNMVTDEAVMIDAKDGDKKVNLLASSVDGQINGVLSYSGE